MSLVNLIEDLIMKKKKVWRPIKNLIKTIQNQELRCKKQVHVGIRID
jgi:hypothetical protein